MRRETPIGLLLAFLCAPLAASLVACEGSQGSAELRVLLEAEDTILEGLEPGEGLEDIRDGWEVRFDAYLATFGDIDLRFSTDDSLREEAPERFAVDLAAVPASGLTLWTLGGLQGGRWDFRYALRAAGGDTARHESVSLADFEQMQAGGYSYLVIGRILREGGRSCPPAALAEPGAATPTGETNARGEPCYEDPEIAFRFGVAAEAAYGPCEVDGVPGVSVPSGGSQTAAITIHGDHLFFNGFPESAEGGVMRLAQWLADCDLDLDGEVTRDELERIAPADLAELDGRFQLGGSPITPLDRMWAYIGAQLRTQAHFQGEGECPLAGP